MEAEKAEIDGDVDRLYAEHLAPKDQAYSEIKRHNSVLPAKPRAKAKTKTLVSPLNQRKAAGMTNSSPMAGAVESSEGEGDKSEHEILDVADLSAAKNIRRLENIAEDHDKTLKTGESRTDTLEQCLFVKCLQIAPIPEHRESEEADPRL